MIGLQLRVAAAGLVVLAAATPVRAGKSDNSIRFASADVLESIDAYFNNARLGVILGQHIWDTLIYRDPATNEHRGLLATEWKWLDETTLELDLRQGVRFHDGEEFGADDVVYTLNFIAKPENKVVNQRYVDWIARAEKIGQYKVRVATKRPTPAALEYLAEYVPIYPKVYYEKVGPQGMNQKPIGSGPFRVVEHALGRFVRLERNPDYFPSSLKGMPKIDKLEVRFVPDRQTQIAAVLSGSVDFIVNVGSDQAAQLQAVPGINVHFGETQRIAFLHLNTTEQSPSPQLRNVLVRKAILHAIDRETMVRTLVGEGARVIHAICFPDQFGCIDAAVPRYEYDPGKAKRLLAEAGYPGGFDLGIHAYRERPQTEAIINYLRQVGIRANLQFLQYAAMREQVRAGKAAFAHETWGTLVNDVSALTSVFFKFTADDVNRDPEVRELLEQGDSALATATRQNAYSKALALIQERAYAVPLFSLPTSYVTAKDLLFTPPKDENPKFWQMSWK
jgi:peptide/nickel transport system substrate-binding protein